MSALPGIFALMGVIALAWAQSTDHQRQQDTIDDQKTKQASICNVVWHKYFIFANKYITFIGNHREKSG